MTQGNLNPLLQHVEPATCPAGQPNPSSTTFIQVHMWSCFTESDQSFMVALMATVCFGRKKSEEIPNKSQFREEDFKKKAQKPIDPRSRSIEEQPADHMAHVGLPPTRETGVGSVPDMTLTWYLAWYVSAWCFL